MSLAAAVRITPIVDAMMENGHEVKVITTKASKDVKGYNISTTFFQGPKNNQGFAKRLFSEILFGLEIGFRALFSKSDAYLVTSPPFFMTLIVITLIRLKRKPYVLDIRDDYPRIFKEQGLIKETHFLYRFFDKMAKRAYLKALVVTGATAGLVHNISEKAGKAAQVHLLRNGFVNSKIPSTTSKREKFTLVFHGNLGKFQNIELLLEVAEKLSQETHIEFLVIGSGSNDYLLKESQLDNVTFLGRLPHDQIMTEIATCHLGVSFRIDGRISQDAFPVKVYEYIGVGLPTIITPECEAGAFVNERKIGLEFANKDVDGIVDTILKLSQDEDFYRSLSENTMSARGGFDRADISRQLVNLLEQKLN